MIDKLSLVVDMYGCPNRCRHCWLGHVPHENMKEGTDAFIVDCFKPYFREIEYYSWLREPDFVRDYAARWERDCALSVNTKPERFELASFYRLAREPAYASFLKSVGVDAVQLTFFGLEAMTDKYVGRPGAYRELLRATDVLLENGIAPRYQAFINRENRDEIAELLRLTGQWRLEERCRAIGQEFRFFVHEGSCEGENRRLYDLRITRREIPEVLRPYYLDLDALLTEGECCEQLREQAVPFVPHNRERIVLNITSNLDVFFNFTHIAPEWKVGNLLQNAPEELIRRIRQEDTPALNRARSVTLSRLVERYGDFRSEKVFSLGDYKMYLLNRMLEDAQPEE